MKIDEGESSAVDVRLVYFQHASRFEIGKLQGGMRRFGRKRCFPLLLCLAVVSAMARSHHRTSHQSHSIEPPPPSNHPAPPRVRSLSFMSRSVQHDNNKIVPKEKEI